jgi:thiosulfate reductase cytochrome b subunit
MLACGIAAYGPAQLPVWLAWARVAGVRLFGSVNGIKAVFWAANAAHGYESSVAWCLARKHEPHNAAAWALQTAVLGYPSLSIIQARYRKKRSTGR